MEELVEKVPLVKDLVALMEILKTVMDRRVLVEPKMVTLLEPQMVALLEQGVVTDRITSMDQLKKKLKNQLLRAS